MALFVVACGILLMLGGAIALLFGFDIVMTERGAAMTIGGVVALSGGVIAVGIGLALVRLNQLLRALEARAARPLRPAVPDRPVVPIAADEDRLPPAAAEPTIPPARELPLKAPHETSPAPLATAAVAGVAAGLGAAAVLGRTSAEVPAFATRDPLPADSAPAADSALDEATAGSEAPALAGSDIFQEPSPRQDAPEAVVAVPDTATASVDTPRDLEEELSRALAETSVLEEPSLPARSEPTLDERPFSEAEDRSFEVGLSKLLGRPIHAPAMQVDPPPAQDLAEMLVLPTAATAPTETVGETAGTPELVDQIPLDEPIEELPSTPHHWNVAAPTEERQSEAPDERLEVTEENQPEAAGLESIDKHSDDDLFDDPPPANPVDPDGGAEQPLMVAEEPSSAPEPPPAPESPPVPVLGTYTIGGRTYRMFGDGSVEAVSEDGEIERFGSMDELRKHLARA